MAIILAAYNGEEWIEEQILSIVNQIEVKPCIFISLDKSSDASASIVNRLSKKHGCIKIISTTKVFGSAAINFLYSLQKIDLSSFSYLAFSDQDDIWMRNKLSVALHCIGESNYEAYSSNLVAFDNIKGKVFILNKSSRQKSHDYMFQGMSAGCTYVLTKKSALLAQEKVSSLPISYFKSMSHDWLIYAICRSHGFSWFHDSRSYIFYRQHSNNVYGALPGVSGLVYKLKLSRTGWYREHIIKLLPLLKNDMFERKIISSLKHYKLRDKLWLMRNSSSFRRTMSEIIFLFFILSTNLI